MEDTAVSQITQEVYVPQKLKAFMSEPQGCALVSHLENQFQCSISVVNDFLTVSSGTSSDLAQIEKTLRDVWQKREVQLMIREAALNVSCTHICQTILPRAYCAVVFFFSSDFQRRSRCNDIILDQFTGKVTIFGSEQAVNMAREMMIECLTDHFGLLEMDIPLARRTTRMGYDLSTNVFNPDVPPPQVPFLNSMLPMGEPNAVLSPTSMSPATVESAFSTPKFDTHLIFPSDFTAPPPPMPVAVQEPVIHQKTNNVEKTKQWIPTSEVGKILGNRAAMKKQIEGQFNCVITVHTEIFSQFGMTAVEIMAQNKEQCRGASSAVMALMQSNQDKPASSSTSTDSGFNSPTTSPISGEGTVTTPEKKGPKHFHRSSFRDQPKIMLALTPRKPNSPVE